MKKLVFMFVAVAAISFASCGNQSKPAEAPVDSLEVVDDSAQNDSLQNDSTQTVANDSTANAQ